MASIPEVDADQVSLSDDDPEMRKEARVFATTVEPHDHGALHEEAFKKFSTWSSLRRAIATLITRARSSRMSDARYDISKREPEQRLSPDVLTQATNIIVKVAQNEGFKEEVAAIASIQPQTESGRKGIKERKRELRKSHLYRLDPYVDDAGILRVSRRLRWSNLSTQERHPVLLPKGHHVSIPLLSHYHHDLHH